jgi:hypothetical protein
VPHWTRIVIFVVGIRSWGCTPQQQELVSHWATDPVTVDGRGDEWVDIALNRVEAADLSWGIMNDSDNLYFLLVTWNGVLAHSIENDGVTLWFDGKGGKAKDFGVHVSSATSTDGGTMAATILAKGKARLAANQTNGPAAAAGRQDRLWSYEVRVPMSLDPAATQAIKVTPGTKLAIGVEMTAPEMPEKAGMSESPVRGERRGPGGGMGGPMGGGGMGGPMGGGGMGGPMGSGMGGGTETPEDQRADRPTPNESAGSPEDNPPVTTDEKDEGRAARLPDRGRTKGKRHHGEGGAEHFIPRMKTREIWLTVTLANAPAT